MWETGGRRAMFGSLGVPPLSPVIRIAYRVVPPPPLPPSPLSHRSNERKRGYERRPRADPQWNGGDSGPRRLTVDHTLGFYQLSTLNS